MALLSSILLRFIRSISTTQKFQLIFVYLMGFLASILCCISQYTFSNGPIFPAFETYYLNGTSGKESLLHTKATFLSIGICIPVIADYFIDVLSRGMFKNRGFVQRGMVIFIMFVPDVVFSAYAFPYRRYDLTVAIFFVRLVVTMTSAYTFLLVSVDGCFQTWEITISYLLSIFVFVMGSFSVHFSPEVYNKWDYAFWAACAFSLACLMISNFKWFKILRKFNYNEWSDNQWCCTVYLVSINLMTISIFFLRYFLVIRKEPSLAVVAFRYIIMLYLLTITILHARIHRSQVMQTQRTLETKRTFVRLVSHEIRTPLNIVVTGLKLLFKAISDKHNDEDLLDIISDAQTSCDIAVALLDDLLAYEKLESGLMILEKEEVSAVAFIENSVQPFYIQARHQGVDLSIQYTHQSTQLKRLMLHIDKKKLHQVMRNLISNALKFTPPGGSVTITAEIISKRNSKSGAPMSKPHLQINVVDTGAGISKENLPMLFNHIIQFHAAKLQNGGGSGLGLWLSKSIIDLHDGTITASSPGEGQGCTFSITIPVKIPSTSMRILDSLRIHHGRITKSKPGPVPSAAASPKILSRSARYAKVNPDLIPRIKSQSIPMEKEVAEKVNLETGGDNGNSGGGLGNINHLQSDTEQLDYIAFGDTRLAEPKPVSCIDNDLDISLIPEEKQHLEEGLYDSVEWRLLMVDDSAMGRKMMRRTFKDTFGDIQEAANGLVCVSMVEESMGNGKPFDVIVMDYQMPLMDGPTASRLVRDLGFNGLIIGVTGNALAEDVNNFLAHGANIVLSKPLDIEAFNRFITEEFYARKGAQTSSDRTEIDFSETRIVIP